MIVVTASEWVVRCSAQSGKGWRGNYEARVICESARGAILLAETYETREDMVVHSVERAGSSSTILIDEGVLP